MQFHKIKIHNDGVDDTFVPTYVEIDGEKFERIKSIEFGQHVGEVPICVIETYAIPDLDTMSTVYMQFTSKTVDDATKVLRHNLRRSLESDDEIGLYEKFVCRLENCLDKARTHGNNRETAKKIADMLILED